MKALFLVLCGIWVAGGLYTLYLCLYLLVELFKYQKSNTGSYWP